jgi:hypothetical protein
MRNSTSRGVDVRHYLVPVSKMLSQTAKKTDEAITMFAMVSSNLADLMGAIRPRDSQDLQECKRVGGETTESGQRESRANSDVDDSEHNI